MEKSRIVFYLVLVLWVNVLSNIVYVKNQHGEPSNEIDFRNLYNGFVNKCSLFLMRRIQGRENRREEVFRYFEKDETCKYFLQSEKLESYYQWILHLINETKSLWKQLKTWIRQAKYEIVNINRMVNEQCTKISLSEPSNFMFGKESWIPYVKRKCILNNESVRNVKVLNMNSSSRNPVGKRNGMLKSKEHSSELFLIDKLKNTWKQIYEFDPMNRINKKNMSVGKNMYFVRNRLYGNEMRTVRNLSDNIYDYYDDDDDYYNEDDESSDYEDMDDVDYIGDNEDELARLYAQQLNVDSDDDDGKYHNYSGNIYGNDSGYDDGDDDDGDDDDDHKDYNYNDIEIYGMSDEELGADFDTVTPATEKTKKGDAEEETFVDNSPSITNKKHVYDFSTNLLLPTNAKSQISRVKGEVKEPFTEVVITCPLKTEQEEKFKEVFYEPEKAPFVVYYEDTSKLKEKKLSDMIHGIIIPPKVSTKKNSFVNRSIQFIFPPHVKTEATFFVICDNSKTTAVDLKGHRGLVEITVKPYGDIFKGCDYSNKEKGYFEKLIDLTPEGAHPCFIQANSNDIIGIKFPTNLKKTTCFEQMSTMISDLEDEDPETQDINNIITGSVTYNKDLSEKYFNTKYVHIPLSFRKNINLSCTIQLDNDKIYPVYISVNQEINVSVFNLFDTFKIMNKEILVASSVDAKPNESLCDFGTSLKKQHEETNKIVICRKKLKEFDKITVKCDKTSTTYPNIKFLSTITATEAQALEIDTHFQLHIAKKFFGLPSRNMRMLNFYPPYFSLLFEGILRQELVTASKLRKYLNTSSIVSERDSTMQVEYTVLKKYMEELTKNDLKTSIPEMKITVGVDANMYEVSLEVPPVISSNPMYLLIGCDNTSDKDGNMGIVELFIAKTEHILKGCNFHETKVSYLTQNIASGTHECLIDAYADDIVGLNCVDQTKASLLETDVKLLPDTCFSQVYKDDTVVTPVDITTIVKGALVYNFNGKKTPAFLKVPQHELAADTKINCSCEVSSVKKTIKITFKKKGEVKPKTEVKQDSKLDDFTMICPDRDAVLPKQRRMSNHDMEYTCDVKAAPGFHYVEIFCPKKDHAIFSDVKLYYNTKKPSVKNDNTVFDEAALQTLVPYSEILYKAKFRKGKTIKQKIDLSHMYLFFPAYVTQDVDFTIVCDNSETIIDNYKGEKHTYHIEINKAEVEKVRGCDFSGNASAMFKDVAANKVCKIDVKPKERIGFVCPPNTIKLSKCFKEVFVDNKLTDLFEEMKITNNLANYTYTHNFNYFMIPSIVKKSISFNCYCVNLKKSDTVKYGFISYNNLKHIYRKLSLDFAEFEETRYKNLETTQYVHTPLSEAGNKIKKLFDKIDLNKQKEVPPVDPLAPALDKLATFQEEEDEEDESFTEEVEDYEFIEDTMTKDILANIEKMDTAEYETYTLTVNITAPTSIEPEQVKDKKYVCDFSRDNLIIKKDMDTTKKEIHCFAPLEPLDTLTVVCPTLKGTYDAKVGTLQTEEKEALKAINTYPKTPTLTALTPANANKFEFTDLIINDESLSEQLIKPFSFTEADFQKTFTTITYKPADFLEKVLDENASDAEKDVATMLPGALFTKMGIMDEKVPFYSSATIIIPPISKEELLIKVVCDNSEYKDADKHVGYVGSVHIMISKNINKIKGCDFSGAASDMFLQAKALTDSTTVECAVTAVGGEYFGIKCPDDADLTPEKCFTEILVDPSSTNKKSTELFPSIITYSLSSITKPKYAYAKIPADNLFKAKFHCTCTKADSTTIGKMEVTYSAAEPELAKAKVYQAKTKKGLHTCDFLNNEELTMTENDDIVVCKMAPTLFSEVQIIYPDFSKNEALANYKLDPLDEHKRLNFYSDMKSIIPAWEALPGSFGHRHFTFVRAKDSVAGEGYSFFVPPIRHDLNLLLYIVDAKVPAAIKKKAYVFIYIKKNVNSLIKGCDFTNSENVLTNNLKIAKKNDPCTIKIKKGDVFGIICPKAASLVPHACFNQVILEYYKPKNENPELQTYLHDLKYNMKPKEIVQYLRELQSELDKLKNYLESSNITRLLGFHNVGLFDIPSDHKQYFTAAYSKVPDNFDAIISFSCYCYKSDDNTFGTMNVEADVTEIVQEDAAADEGSNIILPFVEKAEDHVNLKDQKPQTEAAKLTTENPLQNSINYTCDSTKNDILNLVGNKGVISYCDIQANALDIVTIKCPPVHDTQLTVYKTETLDTPVDLESAKSEEDLKPKKLIIEMNRKKYPVYQDDDKLFSLKDLYMNHFYGFYKTDAEHLEKLKKHTSTTESFFPNHLGEYVYESNMAVKIKNLLPGTVFLKGSLDDKTIESMGDVIKNGVFSFFIPPYVKEDVQFHAVCTKQASLPTTQDKISKMVVVVHIAANKNMIQGCDFINENDANSLHPPQFINIKPVNADQCLVQLVPNEVIGINCSSALVKPEKCFKEIFQVTKVDTAITIAEVTKAENKVSLNTLIPHAYVVENNEDKRNSYVYLILPSLFPATLDPTKMLVCACGKRSMQMIVDKKYINKKETKEVTHGKCTYNVKKKEVICDIIEALKADPTKSNKIMEYEVTLSRWYSLTIKYPTIRKVGYENMVVNPLTIKKKVLFKNRPTDLETILPGSIMKHEKDSINRNQISKLRVPPYVGKDVDYSLEFRNSTVTESQQQQITHHSFVRIHVRIKEGYSIINGCDFTGNYSNLFKFKHTPKTKEEKTCNIVIGPNEFTGFSCLSYQRIKPNNCFASVYENVTNKTVRHIREMSAHAEFDYIMQNSAGYSISYIMFKKEEKSKLTFSCLCKSKFALYTINVVYDPAIDTTFTISDRATVQYLDKNNEEHKKYFLPLTPKTSAATTEPAPEVIVPPAAPSA